MKKAYEPNQIQEQREHLSVMEQMEEFMFLGLRKMQGVSEKEFETQFGNALEECYGKQIERFLKEGLLERKDGYLNLTKSGIDVRIIVPHIPDKWYVHPVTQYNYLELLEAGVRIYEYTPGFIHSKIFVSDDSVATVGTVNMDYRSFNLHFECGVWMAANKTVRDIKEHYRDLLSVSREITIEDWYNTPRLVRLKRAILHVFAPFM